MKFPIPAISFASPEYLWLLAALPFAVALYLLVLHRRKKATVRYGNFGMLKRAVGTGGRIRRHIPPALFLTALTLMLVAIARPTAVITVSSHKSTVILSMDVSGSMRATDVKPSRVEAMQAAAKAYIGQQRKEVLMGIVAFAASAFLVQSPTSDHSALNAAIDRLELQRGTAVGSGILMSLATLFPDEDFAVNPFAARGDPIDPRPCRSPGIENRPDRRCGEARYRYSDDLQRQPDFQMAPCSVRMAITIDRAVDDRCRAIEG